MKAPEGYYNEEVRHGFKIESMMKRAWAAQIEVLLEVERICKKHNIQYFADWGTLLGAVRHKGFIPWDDDVDITMKRQDYIRFCQIAPVELSHGMQLINIHNEPGWNKLLARVITGRCIDFNKSYLEKYHGCPYSIGVDIFIIDYLPENDEERKFLCDIIKIVECSADMIKDSDEEEREGVKRKIEQLCGVSLSSGEPLETQLLKLGERLSMMYSEQESPYLALIPEYASGRAKGLYLKEYFSETVEVPFEYITLPAPIGYEKVLEINYGPDYMTPINKPSHDYPFYKKQYDIVCKELGLDEKDNFLLNMY